MDVGDVLVLWFSPLMFPWYATFPFFRVPKEKRSLLSRKWEKLALAIGQREPTLPPIVATRLRGAGGEAEFMFPGGTTDARFRRSVAESVSHRG